MKTQCRQLFEDHQYCQSEDIITAVNETLSQFRHKIQFQDYSFFYDLYSKINKEGEQSVTFEPGEIISCEINAGLWEKAIMSGVSCLTKQKCPDYQVVQEFINYLLNADSTEDFGLLEDFFWKLILTHPPRGKMLNYYTSILNDHFLNVNGKNKEERKIFFWLLEMIAICFESLNKGDVDAVTRNQSQVATLLIQGSSKIDITGKINTKNIIYFKELSSKEKLKRCLIALNFLYNIFETNFAFWLYPEVLTFDFKGAKTKPLLSLILWPESYDKGLLNSNCKKLLNVYRLVLKSKEMLPEFIVVNKLLSLLGEIIRLDDIVEGKKYPFFGPKLYKYSQALSDILHENIIQMHEENSHPSHQLLVALKPAWLRLLLCSHLLSNLTGYQCLPELSSAYDIFEHFVHPKTVIPEKRTELVGIIKSRLRPRKVNYGYSVNELLHKACELNNIKELQALLKAPELDINAIDDNGWTALHIAASKGNSTCAEELLQFSPKNSQKSLNTRYRSFDGTTPLMCAAKEGHVHVCRLLLEHTGSVLLDDINNLNQSPLELSANEEVMNILTQYKNNVVWTEHSHNNLQVKPKFRELVLRLCVEMIQAYFCTHRTWDFYQNLSKRQKKSPNGDFPEADLKWDYLRYHRDIKTNISKLRKLVPSLKNVPEFQSSYEFYTRILSLNKATKM